MIFYKALIKYLKENNKILNSLLIISLGFIVFKSFGLVDNIYALNNIFFLNKDYFTEDIFLGPSPFFKYAYYYELLKFLKINIDNDIHALLLHLILHFISIISLFYSIKKIFPKLETSLILLILLTLSAEKSSLLLDGVMSNIVISHVSTPTAFASALNLVFLYFLVSKNIFGILFIPLAALMISIKVSWFIVATSIVYFLFFLKGKKKLLALLPTILSLAYVFKDFNLLNTLTESLELYKFSYDREYYATMFSKQNIVRILVFIFSFPLLYFLIKKKIEDQEIKKVLSLVLILQLVTFLVIFCFEIIDLNRLKIWQLIAISPVRSTAFYEIIFKIISCSIILDLFFKHQNKLIFPFIFSSIFFFKFGYLGNFLSLIFFLICFVLVIFKNKISISFNKNIIILLSIIIILPSIIYVNIIDLKKNVTLNFYKNEKRIFFNELTIEKYKILSKYKNCKDFLFHDTTGNFYQIGLGLLPIQRIKNWSSNSIIKKSVFFTEVPYLYGNLRLLRLNDFNFKIISKIHNYISEDKEIDEQDVNILKEKKLILLIRSSDKKLFEKNFVTLDDDFGYTFIVINYNKNILREC